MNVNQQIETEDSLDERTSSDNLIKQLDETNLDQDNQLINSINLNQSKIKHQDQELIAQENSSHLHENQANLMQESDELDLNKTEYENYQSKIVNSFQKFTLNKDGSIELGESSVQTPPPVDFDQSFNPNSNPDELEEKERLIEQVLELLSTYKDLSCRVESIKREQLKLTSENKVLSQYVENLMSASNVFQSTIANCSNVKRKMRK